MDWETLRDWLLATGDMYGVDPIVFAILYFGTLPFVAASLLWLLRNRRQHRAVGIPLLSAASFSLPAHVYVVLQSENIPFWGYAIIACCVAYGFWRMFLTSSRPVKH